MPHHGEYRPINRLRDILGVATVWAVDPTNLVRCTDDEWDVATGIGNDVLLGAGQFGQLDFDMGAIHNVEIRCKFLFGNNVGGGAEDHLIILGSEDGVNYYPIDSGYYGRTAHQWMANVNLTEFTCGFVRARYIRLTFHANGAGTFYGAIYEIQAVDDGL